MTFQCSCRRRRDTRTVGDPKKWLMGGLIVLFVILGLLVVAALCSDPGTFFPYCPCKLHT